MKSHRNNEETSQDFSSECNGDPLWHPSADGESLLEDMMVFFYNKGFLRSKSKDAKHCSDEDKCTPMYVVTNDWGFTLNVLFGQEKIQDSDQLQRASPSNNKPEV